jgi:hypothetical protein
MTLSDWASLGSFVSGVAVLVSLVYLNVQVRQSKADRHATIRALRATRNTDIFLKASEPSLAEAISKAVMGASDVSNTQLSQFRNYCRANFYNTEDAFYHHREGSLNDAAYVSLIRGIRSTLAWPGVRVIWKRSRGAHGSEFVEFIDKIIAEVPVAVPVDALAQWKADMAVETAGTPH